MCGRFAQDIIEEEVLDLFDQPSTANFPEHRAKYNGAPTQKFIICRHDDNGHASLASISWGLVPFWSKDRSIGSRLINARSETVATDTSNRDLTNNEDDGTVQKEQRESFGSITTGGLY